MIKFIWIFFFTAFAYLNNIFAQKDNKLDLLCRLCDKASSDSDKVVALTNLANYYYNNKLITQGDSVLYEQLRIADLNA